MVGFIVQNNDVLRRVRYIFDFSDAKMMELFVLGDLEASREEVSDWMKKDDDPAYVKMKNIELAAFLNGFISERRGKREGVQPIAETELNNNIIFRKLRIALDFQSEQILALLASTSSNLSKHELSAFFRKSDHKHFRKCQDQVLRNFLNALQHKYRDEPRQLYKKEGGGK